MVSNHHLHAVAGVTIACAEMLEFGKAYAAQIIKNAKALAQALFEKGFAVLAEHKGFTQSHVILIDITELGDGGRIEKLLEQANIIINRNLLPWDIKEGRHFKHPGGIRLGVSEVTRLGMKESEMLQIAEFIKKVIIDKKTPETVKPKIEEFRKEYTKIHYCFENSAEAYKYMKL
jgi:glycine hydroxymethyltransferase